MKLSVVVPAYNAERTLERCAASILAQEGVEVELVVVDDGSTDATPDVIEKLSANHDNVIHLTRRNGGLCAARNSGLDRVSGDWVFFADADDWLYPGALATMAEHARDGVCAVWAGFAGPGVGTPVGSMSCCVGRDDVARRIVGLRDPFVRQGGFTLSIDGTLVRTAWCKLYRAQLLTGEDPVRFRLGLFSGADALFNLDYLARAEGEVAIVSNAAYCYDVDQSNMTKSFSQLDADALPVFCAQALDAARPFLGKGEPPITRDDMLRFAGAEVLAVISKASRFGAGAAETGAMLQPALTDPLVRESWGKVRAWSPASHAVKLVMTRLVDAGYPTAAMGLHRVALAMRHPVRSAADANARKR